MLGSDPCRLPTIVGELMVGKDPLRPPMAEMLPIWAARGGELEKELDLESTVEMLDLNGGTTPIWRMYCCCCC